MRYFLWMIDAALAAVLLAAVMVIAFLSLIWADADKSTPPRKIYLVQPS